MKAKDARLATTTNSYSVQLPFPYIASPLPSSPHLDISIFTYIFHGPGDRWGSPRALEIPTRNTRIPPTDNGQGKPRTQNKNIPNYQAAKAQSLYVYER